VPLQSAFVEQQFAMTSCSQTPLTHASVVQKFASLQSEAIVHGSQPAIGVCTQPSTSSHASVVHTLLSLQSRGAPLTQTPPWHVPADLQPEHAVPFAAGVWTQPVVASHVSAVHGLLSSQSRSLLDAQSSVAATTVQVS
jgi:hypothetical protein